MNTKHGVTSKDIHSYEAIADKALSQYYTHIWALSDPPVSLPVSHDAYSFQVCERHKRVATVSVWKRGAGHVDIIFPNNTAWVEGVQAFRDTTQQELIEAIRCLENALGVPVMGSPASTGWSLLKKLHPEWLEAVPVDLRKMHFRASAGSDLIWQPKQHTPTGFRYVHKFDKRSAYPAAATQTDIGTGVPVHLTGVAAKRAATHEKGHPQEVGVWLCIVMPTPAVDTSLPPKLIEIGDYWLSGPRIRMLQSAGYSVTPVEGNVFEQRHDVLAKWANVLLSVRQRVTNERAQKGLKQIANSTIGFTAFKGFEDLEDDEINEEEKRRPDIRLQVVSRNAEIMWHNLDKVRREQHETPCMVYMDACYYFSNALDGAAAFPVLMQPKKIGEFKYEGRIELTADVQAMFARKLSVAERLEYLNKIGWQK